MIGRTCPDCGHIHASTDVQAIGRFRPTPIGYRGDFPWSPLRQTRAEAMRDACLHRQNREPKETP